jgi:hypothetical protein
MCVSAQPARHTRAAHTHACKREHRHTHAHTGTHTHTHTHTHAHTHAHAPHTRAHATIPRPAAEWSDFSIFSNLNAPLSKAFFPSGSPATEALQFWGIFAMGLVARPVGERRFVAGPVGELRFVAGRSAVSGACSQR